MINIQKIDDNECFKWCLVRYLIRTDRHPIISIKNAKYFAKRVDSKEIKFPVKTRDIYTIEKKNSIGIRAFVIKTKYPNVVIINMLVYY